MISKSNLMSDQVSNMLCFQMLFSFVAFITLFIHSLEHRLGNKISKQVFMNWLFLLFMLISMFVWNRFIILQLVSILSEMWMTDVKFDLKYIIHFALKPHKFLPIITLKLLAAGQYILIKFYIIVYCTFKIVTA